MEVEEAFAVRSSLLDALEERLIDNNGQQVLIECYKKKYGKDHPFFPVVYNALDFVAGKIGKIATGGLITSVLETQNPSVAFSDLILGMCKIDPHAPNEFLWDRSDEHTGFLANLSLEHAHYFFSSVIDGLDPDDSLYGKTSLLDYVLAIKQEWGIRAKKLNDFGKLLYCTTPNTILFMEYTNLSHTFRKYKFSEEVSYGNFVILLEAIRQQLIIGMGLLCPFWNSSLNCCSSSNKALLEKVWSHTSPDPSKCKLWKRLVV